MTDSHLHPGDTFLGKYRIERELGAGNMGRVYLAEHLGLEQRVAIKLMRPAHDPQAQAARFLREARICARLTSPHVAKVFDVGVSEHGPFLVMEYLVGRDLAAELEARGPLPVSDAVEYVVQACEALAEAHAAGVVHRDIKPANLFLTTALGGVPCVKVLDFGVSKMTGGRGLALTAEAHALGSPLYMSPEQIDDAKSVDMRADLWSLGVTLYELVAGTPPFMHDHLQDLLVAIVMRAPPPPSQFRADLPPGFEAVLLQCLEKDRARRWPNAAALAAALAPFAPARATVYIERIATLLGEQVAAARSTDLLPPEPPAKAGLGATSPLLTAAGTGGAVVRTTLPSASAPRSRTGRLAPLGVGAGVILLAALGSVLYLRSPAARGPAAATSPVPPTPSPTLPAPSAAPPAPSERDGARPVPEPTSQPTVTPAGSATVASTAKPRAPAPAPRPKVEPKPPPAPATKGFYDGR
jgi:serine/threonine-protein kinase